MRPSSTRWLRLGVHQPENPKHRIQLKLSARTSIHPSIPASMHPSIYPSIHLRSASFELSVEQPQPQILPPPQTSREILRAPFVKDSSLKRASSTSMLVCLLRQNPRFSKAQLQIPGLLTLAPSFYKPRPVTPTAPQFKGR